MSKSQSADEGVDTHDAAGMARWLRERAKANRQTLEPAPGGGWILPQWRVNLMPHIAFRLEQAATLLEEQEKEVDGAGLRSLQLLHERDCAVEDVAWLSRLNEDVADAVVSRLYRRFKEWSKRGFSSEDVTWCEVKADVLEMIRQERTAADVTQPQTEKNDG